MTNAGSDLQKLSFSQEKFEGRMISPCHGMAHGLPQVVCLAWGNQASFAFCFENLNSHKP